MDIETKSLTACEVTPDGSAILLGFVDTDGKPATIRLSLNQVGALAMTLPEPINKALRVRFDDQSLRYAYPLASWTVERSSDPATGMVTLSTVDGFTVCFSMRRRIARRTWRGAGHRVCDQNPGACELNRTVDWKVFPTPCNRCVYPCRGYPCSPRHHGDALVRAEPKHFAFLFAVQQVDVILARDLECRRTCNRYTAAIHQGRSCRISRNPRSQSSSPALSLSSRFARRAPDAVSSRPAASPIPPPRTISHGPRIRPMNIGE
jgi:hypothetical protein